MHRNQNLEFPSKCWSKRKTFAWNMTRNMGEAMELSSFNFLLYFVPFQKKKVKKSNNIERSKNTRQSSPCNPLLLLFFGFQFKHGGLQKGATVQTPNPSCYLYGTLMAFPSRTMIPITCNNVN
jgi:hypothetical protein